MHTPIAQAMRTLCSHWAQVARIAPCRGLHSNRVVASTGVVSWLCPAVSQSALAVSQAVSHAHVAVSSLLSVTIQKLYRDPNPAARRVLRAAAHVATLLHRVAKRYGAVSQPCCSISRHQTVAPSHDTKFVSRLTPWPGHPRARSPLAPAHRPAV